MNCNRYCSLVALLVLATSNGSASASCNLEEFEQRVRDGQEAQTVVRACHEFLTLPTTDRYQILDWAVRMGAASLVESLIDLGYWPEEEGKRDALLFYALWSDKDPADLVSLLISKGASANRAARRFDIVYDAIELGYTATLDVFLEEMPDKEALYRPQNLFAAVSADNVNLVRQILDRGVEPDYVTDEGKRTPLMLAAERGVSDAVLFTLIDRGARCSSTDPFGKGPLEYAKNPGVRERLERICGQR